MHQIIFTVQSQSADSNLPGQRLIFLPRWGESPSGERSAHPHFHCTRSPLKIGFEPANVRVKVSWPSGLDIAVPAFCLGASSGSIFTRIVSKLVHSDTLSMSVAGSMSYPCMWTCAHGGVKSIKCLNKVKKVPSSCVDGTVHMFQILSPGTMSKWPLHWNCFVELLLRIGTSLLLLLTTDWAKRQNFVLQTPGMEIIWNWKWSTLMTWNSTTTVALWLNCASMRVTNQLPKSWMRFRLVQELVIYEGLSEIADLALMFDSHVLWVW